MNSKILIIYNSIKLFEIFKEIKENLNFEIEYLNKGDLKKKDFSKYRNYLIISTHKNLNIHNLLLIKTLPIKINELIEKINLRLLKNQFNNQSEISIGKYKLNLNSRKISDDKNELNLTEKEADVIIFLKKSKKPVSIDELQTKVWGHSSKLDTHTVETHIYRLRKKIANKFNDDEFIISTKLGYNIK